MSAYPACQGGDGYSDPRGRRKLHPGERGAPCRGPPDALRVGLARREDRAPAGRADRAGRVLPGLSRARLPTTRAPGYYRTWPQRRPLSPVFPAPSPQPADSPEPRGSCSSAAGWPWSAGSRASGSGSSLVTPGENIPRVGPHEGFDQAVEVARLGSGETEVDHPCRPLRGRARCARWRCRSRSGSASSSSCGASSSSARGPWTTRSSSCGRCGRWPDCSPRCIRSRRPSS